MNVTEFVQKRDRMVADQLEARGIRDSRVLAAMRKVPRERFVDEAMRERAYDDGPLPIGYGQTISQPYMVARTGVPSGTARSMPSWDWPSRRPNGDDSGPSTGQARRAQSPCIS